MFRWDLAWRLREACCADMSANYANQEIGVPRGTDPWRCLRLGELGRSKQRPYLRCAWKWWLGAG